MHQGSRVLLKMDPPDANFFPADFQMAVLPYRNLVLRYLEVLCKVGVEICFARKEKFLVNLAVQRKPNHNAKVNGFLVQHGFRARKAKANGANPCVWFDICSIVCACRAVTEKF